MNYITIMAKAKRKKRTGPPRPYRRHSPTHSPIYRARKKLGESQLEFAKRFGVDQSTIWYWENNGIPTHGMASMAIKQVLADLARAATT